VQIRTTWTNFAPKQSFTGSSGTVETAKTGPVSMPAARMAKHHNCEYSTGKNPEAHDLPAVPKKVSQISPVI
jgi:hypothetical protein